jgi:hypothetical protein
MRGTLTLDDLRRVLFYGVFRRPQAIGTLVLASFVLISIVLMVLIVPGGNAVSIALRSSPFVVLLGFWCFFMVAIPFRSAKKRFVGETVWQEPAEYSFDPEQIRVNRPNASSAMNWNVVTEVRETRSLFLLQLGSSSSIPLPKRFFASEAEIGAWKQLVLSRVPSQRAISPHGLAARWC